MNTPITVAATRRVRPGFEAKFEAALHDFIVRSEPAAGQGSVHVIKPAPNSSSRHYGILRTFESIAKHDAFYASELFQGWEEEVEHMVEGETRYEHISGFEGCPPYPEKPQSCHHRAGKQPCSGRLCCCPTLIRGHCPSGRWSSPPL